MLRFFDSITGHYAIALILYALVFKILFLPFGIKQQKNQIKMAKLTPKIEVIKAKYRGRNDQVTQRKMQEEIMALQQQEGYSPLSGCLPLLLQMPVIFWLFKVIRMPLTYIAGWSDEWIVHVYKTLNPADLSTDVEGIIGALEANNGNYQIQLINKINESGIDFGRLPNFLLGGTNLANDPSFKSWLIIIPLLAAGFQWFHMWMTKKLNGNANAVAGQNDAQTNASMKIMDIVMPVMTFVIAMGFPAMMGLYWIYQSVFAILQSLVLAKAMPMPRYTEEQLKQMKKDQKAAEKAQKELLKNQPKYRSLHYIDEDDYDTLPDVKTKDADAKRSSDIDKNLPEIKD